MSGRLILQDEADQAAAANNLGARYTKSRAYLEWAQESGPIVTTVWGDLPFLNGCADNGARCRGCPTWVDTRRALTMLKPVRTSQPGRKAV